MMKKNIIFLNHYFIKEFFHGLNILFLNSGSNRCMAELVGLQLFCSFADRGSKPVDRDMLASPNLGLLRSFSQSLEVLSPVQKLDKINFV
jgi:hypothetical protein